MEFNSVVNRYVSISLLDALFNRCMFDLKLFKILFVPSLIIQNLLLIGQITHIIWHPYRALDLYIKVDIVRPCSR